LSTATPSGLFTGNGTLHAASAAASNSDADTTTTTATAIEPTLVAKVFLRNGESAKEYNPNRAIYFGTAEPMDQDGEEGQLMHVVKYDDGDEEMMNSDEVKNHKVTAARAEKLKPGPREGGFSLGTPPRREGRWQLGYFGA